MVNISLAPDPNTFQVYQLTGADITSDGFKDIITANSIGNSATILFGKGDGTFQSPINYSTGNTPTYVATGDLNRDGKVDLVVSDWTDGTASIFLGNGDGTFPARSAVSTGIYPDFINLEDFNGDGILDLTNRYDSGVSIMLGNGDGTFQSRNIIGAAAGSLSSNAADLNGDGILDIVSHTSSSSVTTLLGNGDGTFQTGATVKMGNITDSTRYVTTGDLNGDGVLDIVTAQRYEDSVSISFAQTIQGRGALLDFSLESRADSLQALGMLGQTLTNINNQRGVIGGSMSRIAVAISNLQIGSENFAAAESRIRDTDVASDTAMLVSSRIIQQSGAAILSQANQQPAIALKLLGL